jgi:hypothetical protein
VAVILILIFKGPELPVSSEGCEDSRLSPASRGGWSMTKALAFDPLMQALHAQLASLPDDRKGKNIQYAITDAALGAFAVFFTQSPSFLAYQRTMKQAKGRSNADSLFGIVDIPTFHRI